MWLLTPIGFFSVVRKPGDEAAQTLTVRSRVHADLERLRQAWLPALGPVVEHGGTDYRYRARVPRAALADAMSRMVLALDYGNFKNEVARRQGKQRASLYGEVWEVLHQLPDEKLPQSQPPSTPAPVKVSGRRSGTKMAYGGVLVNAAGELLLREPKGHYDGYVWTFPKGRPDAGETPEQAALREVFEETGYTAEIVARIPGQFAGGTTVNEFFLMRPVGEPTAFGADETQAITWAAADQAATLIARTTNATGRERDLKVLAAARELLGRP